MLPAECYNSTTMCVYGYELNPSYLGTGNITWFSQGEPAWRLHEEAMGANATYDIGARPITGEPQSIVLNLGMSDSFTTISDTLEFPGIMRIDYVRVYQPTGGAMTTSCSPPLFPTEDYINDHMEAYTDGELPYEDRR